MHDKGIITEVLETLNGVGLHIMKGHTEEHHQHEEEVYFAKSGLKGSVTTDQTREALKALFQKHHKKAQIMVKRMNAAEIIKKNFELNNQISMLARNVMSLKTSAVIDDVEEGYEIVIEVYHAERDPNLVAHIARTLTNHSFDVTSFDMSEATDPDQTHVSLNLFIRTAKGKSPDTRTQKLIKSVITQHLKKYSLEMKTFSIVPVTAKVAEDLSKTVKTTDNIQMVDVMVRESRRRSLGSMKPPSLNRNNSVGEQLDLISSERTKDEDSQKEGIPIADQVNENDIHISDTESEYEVKRSLEVQESRN